MDNDITEPKTARDQAIDLAKTAGVRNPEELLDAVGDPPRGFGTAMIDVTQELQAANARFPKFASKHEGLAIIEEEFLELRDEVFWGEKKSSSEIGYRNKMRTEAKQLAAMAIRFMLDVCQDDDREED